MHEPLVMNWPQAIARNREALLRIVASLFAMLGISATAAAGRIPRSRHSAILRILRPAEAAVRRLIFIAAKDIAVKPSLSRPLPPDHRIAKREGETGARRHAFRLSDNRGVIEPRKRRKFARLGPRISRFDEWKPGPGAAPKRAPEPEDGCIGATRLVGRLLAIRDALEDIPRQAVRLARWKARRRRQAKTRLVFTIPLKAGPCPYLSGVPRHEVEEILRECHDLAWEVRTFDTS
jgi:hypothetical protein